jgi:hypothetical protein
VHCFRLGSGGDESFFGKRYHKTFMATLGEPLKLQHVSLLGFGQVWTPIGGDALSEMMVKAKTILQVSDNRGTGLISVGYAVFTFNTHFAREGIDFRPFLVQTPPTDKYADTSPSDDPYMPGKLSLRRPYTSLGVLIRVRCDERQSHERFWEIGPERLIFVDSVGLGDRRGCDECKELLESEQWLAL